MGIGKFFIDIIGRVFSNVIVFILTILFVAFLINYFTGINPFSLFF